ncbi:LEAF RUST 10 DISEASE-RESISTANCE LOCUS RECEPTOR-LIKE PROTEIN KINASE-like 2.4 isoform X2 [Silene latifolia]|uniref:LEAF RUST 10 DISEASE-RESISTANCE LOCUS RECEPTOR-LIKE PROTEIN KINASE-like 2.4 isoform X2 n=1 Tax=Silene latifolia TaxID=37657 RepID=UPI003D77607D
MNFFYNLPLIILYLLIFVFPICFSSSSLQWYNSCGTNFTCGSVSVGFPFWGTSSRPKECGYPEFELSCEGEIKSTIQIAETKFYVLDIDQTAKSLKIARQDLSEGLCLTNFQNTTMNFDRFYYPQASHNITLLYECPPPPGETPKYSGQFYCNINGINETIGYCQSGATGPNGCSKSVVVPVQASLEADILNGTLDLSTSLDKGFVVNYKVSEEDQDLCSSCNVSKGRCGFNSSKNDATCFCPDGTYGDVPCGNKSQVSGLCSSKNDATCRSSQPRSIKQKRSRKLYIMLLACFSVIGGVCMLLIVLCYVKRKRSSNDRDQEVSQQERKVDVEAFLRSHGSSGPKRYTYTDLKRITNSFKNKIGQGGYGSVYKGQLQNGNLVAVKMLHKSKGDTREFINEVASIGNTNHVNVVKLIGFCYSGHRRALVYEYMSNGSLEKFLFKGNNYHLLGLEMLFKIAIGVARGLEYLHRGCNTRILHFDIKPHNILLDENFCPKISDFGLAKSYPQRDSSTLSITEARGTVGYIAPEVFLKSFGGVSHKSDVYSYGMLVLEMVGCRRKANVEGELSSEQHFPQWIYNQLEQGEETNEEGILSSEEIELQRKMMIVSLWCAKTNPHRRPAMSKVVEMLEGAVELEAPDASSLSASPRSQTIPDQLVLNAVNK